MNTSLAPIVLFVYNRPTHTKKTIEALSSNELAHDSDLIIYSDAPKNKAAYEGVNKVREIVKEVQGFKSVKIVERETNFGLANSIIEGVTEIINQYGKVIVLEDDLVTSPQFLNYMNQALGFYEDKKEVWHISGWNYPIKTDELDDTFLWRTMNCWGWATWSDRWKYFDKDIDKLIRTFSINDIAKFNLDDTQDFYNQIIDNKKGSVSTWAVFWYASIFLNKGLCLNPNRSFVLNIGTDGSGQNCGHSEIYNTKLNFNSEFNFQEDIRENEFMVKRIKEFNVSVKKSLLRRLFSKIGRLIKSLQISE